MSKVNKGAKGSQAVPTSAQKTTAKASSGSSKGSSSNAAIVPAVPEKKEWVPVGRKKLKALYGGVVKAASAKSIGEWTVQEWQRLPKAILSEYCQKQGRVKPAYKTAYVNKGTPRYKYEGGDGEDSEDEEDTEEEEEEDSYSYAAYYNPNAEEEKEKKWNRARVILPDDKRSDKDINICTVECFRSVREAQEMAALLALYTLTPSLPYEKKLPTPFKERWLALQGGANNTSGSMPVTAVSQFTTAAERKGKVEERRVAEVQKQRDRETRVAAMLARLAPVYMSEGVRAYVEEIIRSLQEIQSSRQDTDKTRQLKPKVPQSKPSLQKGNIGDVGEINSLETDSEGDDENDQVDDNDDDYNDADSETKDSDSSTRAMLRTHERLFTILSSHLRTLGFQEEDAENSTTAVLMNMNTNSTQRRYLLRFIEATSKLDLKLVKKQYDKYFAEKEKNRDVSIPAPKLGTTVSSAMRPALDAALDHLSLTVPEHRLPRKYDPRGKHYEIQTFQHAGVAQNLTTWLGNGHLGVPLKVCKRLAMAAKAMIQVERNSTTQTQASSTPLSNLSLDTNQSIALSESETRLAIGLLFAELYSAIPELSKLNGAVPSLFASFANNIANVNVTSTNLFTPYTTTPGLFSPTGVTSPAIPQSPASAASELVIPAEYIDIVHSVFETSSNRLSFILNQSNENLDVWKEHISAVSSFFGDKFTETSPYSFRITDINRQSGETRTQSASSNKRNARDDGTYSSSDKISLTIDVFLPHGWKYPAMPPAIIVNDEGLVLSAGARLKIVQGLIKHLVKKGSLNQEATVSNETYLWDIFSFFTSRDWENCLVGVAPPLPQTWSVSYGSSLQSNVPALASLEQAMSSRGLGEKGMDALSRHVEMTSPINDAEEDGKKAHNDGGADTSRSFSRYTNRMLCSLLDVKLLEEHNEKRLGQSKESLAFLKMLDARSKLPSMQHEKEILDTIRKNQVMILTGETGCGKSTQLPQMILDEAIREGRGGRVLIMCTQPRRISAVGLAERVSSERGEKCGDVIGYQVRLDNRTSKRSRLIFATTGVLLRQLMMSAHSKVPLEGLTHLFIDEVHERSVEIDFLLLVLKFMLPKRPDLRVILMSATVNASTFQRYFTMPGPALVPSDWTSQVKLLNRAYSSEKQPSGTMGIEVESHEEENKYGFDKKDKKDKRDGKKERKDKKEKIDKPEKQDKKDKKEKEDKADKKDSKKENREKSKKSIGLLEVGAGFSEWVEDIDIETESAVKGKLEVPLLEKKVSLNKSLGSTLNAKENEVSTKPTHCPLIEVAGRTFPVTEHFLPEIIKESGFRPRPQFRRELCEEDRIERVESLLRLEAAAVKKGEPNAGIGIESNIESFAVVEESSDGIRYDRQLWRDIANLNDDSSSGLDLGLVEAAIWYVCYKHPGEGAILVFLPGAGEILTLMNRLKHSLRQGIDASTNIATPRQNEVLILPLHGALPTMNQRQVFDRPPIGVRKIVLSTNIAETSITVDDVEFVIDTGKVKETRFDAEKRLSMLVETWCAKANCKQRMGRAGRVKPGHCYKLFTRSRWESMPGQQLPEIQRVLLDHICLMVKTLRLEKIITQDFLSKSYQKHGCKHDLINISARDDLDESGGIARVLSQCIEPPSASAILASIVDLRQIQALTFEERLSPLGGLLARLPVGNTRIGKLLIYGALFRCATPIAIIAALLSEKSPFVSPLEKRDEASQAHKQFEVSRSDHLSLWKLFQVYLQKKKQGRSIVAAFCTRSFVSLSTLQTAEKQAQQYLDALRDIGLIPRVRRQQGSGAVQKRDVSTPSESPEESIDVDDEIAPEMLIAASVPEVVEGVQRNTVLSANNADCKSVHPPLFDANAGDYRMLRAAICAGLYPNVIKVVYPPDKVIKTAHGMEIMQHDARGIRYLLKKLPSLSDLTSHSTKLEKKQEDSIEMEAVDEESLFKDEDEPIDEAKQEETNQHPDSLTAASKYKQIDMLHSKGDVRAMGGRVFMHPKSVHFSARNFECPWLVYLEVVQTSKPFIQGATMASVYSLLLFGGALTVERDGDVIVVDDWIKFKSQGAKIALLVRQLRSHFDNLLDFIIRNPHKAHDVYDSPVTDAIIVLLKTDGHLTNASEAL